MQLLLLLALAQFRVDSLPPPRGFVNDFAAVIDAGTAARMEATLREVRRKTNGDIAVVTLPDLGGRDAADVALQIGRQWKLGGTGPAGDPAKNLGVVLLLEPLHDHRRGSGQVFIATGRGAEGFLNDARVGRIRDAMTPSLGQEDYSGGLEIGVHLLAQAFADEFHVTVSDSTAAAPLAAPDEQPEDSLPGPLIAFLVLLIVILVIRGALRGARGRRGWSGPWWWGGWGGSGGWRGGGFGGGGGGGGGFGGGFGGFGGGGGFSGGGAGGRF